MSSRPAANQKKGIRIQQIIEILEAYSIGLFQKKSTPPPTDGTLEILAGGGVEGSGNPGRRGVWT